MNMSTSECSSGCESGWTMYLDQPSNSSNPYSRSHAQNYEGKKANANEDQEDEDLSMVSDASSGPPHLRENYYAAEPQCCASSAQEGNKKSKQKSIMKETRVKKQHNLSLDDTASSPMLHFSQDNAAPPENHNSTGQFSQVFSATHFEGETTTKKHLGFFKSSTKGKSGSFLGRKRQ